MPSNIVSFTWNKLDSSDSHITIHAIDPTLFSSFTNIRTSLAKWFFITKDIFGSLYETSNSQQFLLLQKERLYVISTLHFNILLLRNYIFTLENDLKRYKQFQLHYSVETPEDVIGNYKQQITLFQKHCDDFSNTYPQDEFWDYKYTQNLKFLISTYANLRSILLWNAESLYDTTQSNNFLLLGVEDLDISSYGRVNTWLIQNQEHYIMNVLNFQNRDSYNIALTSSWMKAIDLTIQYLLSQKKKKILILWNIYFEITKLLEWYFNLEDIAYYDMSNWIEDIWTYIEKYSPDTIFVDSVTLSLSQDIFSKEAFHFLISQLSIHQSKASIILDITTKYIYLEDYEIPSDFKNDILFVWSLVKYLYSWMDLWFWGYLLFPKTMHDLWQIIPNSWAWINNTDALKIPILPKSHHTKISQKINEKINKIRSIILQKNHNLEGISVTFPDIKYNNNSDTDNFYWNLINIDYTHLKDWENIISKYKITLVQKIIAAAKAHNIELSYSTGYGYTNTRFSIFSYQSVKAIPITHPCYIRISIWYNSQVLDIIKLIKIIWVILHQHKK